MRILRDVQAYQARLALDDGNSTPLERWLTRYSQQNDRFPIYREQEALLVTRRHIAQGETADALQLLGEWQVDAHVHGRTESELKLLILTALAYDAQNDASSARATLVQALTLAEPCGYRRLFLDEGPPVAALLQATYPSIDEQELSIYARMLLFDFAEEPIERGARTISPDTEPLIEPLSPREDEVLRLLAAGHSNPEIAEELIVSVNTIKTHVKHIYRKLDVHSREEAGDVARQLNLL